MVPCHGPLSIGLPSSLCHVILGVGLPVAMQGKRTFSPSVTLNGPEGAEIKRKRDIKRDIRKLMYRVMDR